TPLPGISLENRLCVLFDGCVSADGMGPRSLAEPRLAKWIADIVGNTVSIQFKMTYEDLSERRWTIMRSLDRLGLDAFDLMYISAFPASGELTEIERRIGLYMRRNFAVKPGSRITSDIERIGDARRRGEPMELTKR